MIPMSVLLKLGTYKIEINGATIKATTIDDLSLAETYVAEFRPLIERNLVAFDVKTSNGNPELVLICVRTRCLIFQISRLGKFPEALRKLRAEKDICFVSKQVRPKLRRWHWHYVPGTEIGELAARVIKRPELEKCGLLELASAVGITTEQPSGSGTSVASWSAKLFSPEEVKLAMLDVYTCYEIGNKLLRDCGLSPIFKKWEIGTGLLGEAVLRNLFPQ